MPQGNNDYVVTLARDDDQVTIQCRALDMLECLAELVGDQNDTPTGVCLSTEGARGLRYILENIHKDVLRLDVEPKTEPQSAQAAQLS
ncbi:MAG: hypothetical protein ACNA8S_15785 [Deferrisomatales bacterium]